MAEALRKANELRSTKLEQKQTEQAKEKRTEWKKARTRREKTVESEASYPAYVRIF